MIGELIDYAVFGLMMLTAISNVFVVWSLHRISKFSRGCGSNPNREGSQ